MTYRYESCADGVSPGTGSFYNVPVDQYPWLMGRVWSNETLQITDMQNLPQGAHFEMLELASFGVRTMVIVPIQSKDKFIGFIGANSERKGREVSRDCLTLLEVFATVFIRRFLKSGRGAKGQ